jgi:hypothetical protein
MRRPVPVALLAVVATLAAGAGSAGAANECQGLPKCIAVPGPWVVVPARGGAQFLLECPGGKGVIGGTDVRVTTQAVVVSFDGIPGSPVAYGRTTNYEALFRGVSSNARPGAFEPFLGCLPTQGATRNTTGVTVEPHGPPLQLIAKSIALGPAVQRTARLGCPTGERLVDSWTATAFGSAKPPPPGLASAIRVSAAIQGGAAVATISASEALPPDSHALVQLGVRCSTA